MMMCCTNSRGNLAVGRRQRPRDKTSCCRISAGLSHLHSIQSRRSGVVSRRLKMSHVSRSSIRLQPLQQNGASPV